MAELAALVQRHTKLISAQELEPLYGVKLKPRQIRWLVAKGLWPKPIKYSAQRSGWPEDVIERHLAEKAEKPAERPPPPVKARLARPKKAD